MVGHHNTDSGKICVSRCRIGALPANGVTKFVENSWKPIATLK